MAPRGSQRVRIVSPNSGNVTLSRTTSACSSHHHSRSRSAPHAMSKEDSAALRRAQEAMESVQVLRQPFGKPGRPSAAAAEKENTLSVPPPLPPRAPSDQGGRGLKLPSSIPIRRGSSSNASTSSRKRSLSFRDDEDETPQRPLPRRRVEGLAQTYATAYQALRQAVAPPPPPAAEPIAPVRPAAPVCPGMFKGLSAVTLAEKMFEIEDERPHYSSEEERAANADRRGPARRCARPLWSLVGTFKTAITSLVDVDYVQECLKWNQRNPKGGYQVIRVGLEKVQDVIVTRVQQEDEDVVEKQYMAVVRTSTRPSQIVFGFRTLGEANQFKSYFQRK